MPVVDGVFTPPPWKKLSGTLFDVIAPDDPSEPVPATAEDVRWYEELRNATAEILLFIVHQVRRHYGDHRGPSFDHRTVRRMMIRCAALTRDFFDDELSPRKVAEDVNRMAKQFGLIVYSNEPGPRRNWPRHGRLTFTRADAVAVVDDAFHGRWPNTPGGHP